MFARRTNWKLAPNRLTQALQRLQAAGTEIIDLTESNPTRCGLRYDDAQILSALSQPESLGYHPDPKGLRSAREAVAAYYAERDGDGGRIDPDRIVLTTGTSEGYSFVFRLLCDPGDEVLVPSPSYPLFELLADVQDVKLVPYLLFYDHGWQVDMHSLQTAITPRARAVLVVHPNNPTGSYVKPAEAEALSRLCREREMALVADEVFLDYGHGGPPRASFAGNEKALTFVLSGLSKICALPQMKVAWIVTSGPQELELPARERLEVIADTYLSLSTPLQLAAPCLLAQRHAMRAQLLERIAANLAELDSQLARQKACRRLEIEGGWYAVLRVPVTGSDEELALALLEQHSVLVHPGHFYDFPGDGYLVLSLITLAEPFREGVARLLRHISSTGAAS
ncbi:MAG TPA: pyridoxal phosphate-dependent aminotransferase [Terriglobales bacterium]|nr:pyridoxal phosphate-dependent aminotransferase [Terriglobales bacterium]